MKTGPTSVSLVQVNYAFDKELTDPEALVDRYTTLTGWAEAALAAGARRSAVVQRFHTAGRVVRGGVEYVFVDRSLSRVVASLQPDVVHVNGIVFPVRTWALRRTLPETAALVVQSHSDGGAIGRAPVLRLAGRLLHGAADAFLFAAAEHADAWRDAGLVGPAQRIHTVMPASTRVEPIARDAARASTGIRGEPALLWVGRLNANKDPQTVVDAFEAVLRVRPEATLSMIYGTAEMVHTLGARVERSAVLRERVRLVGAVSHGEMAAWFSAADLFVVGSHHEGSGYSLMEALACGATPAITDIPTFRLLTGGGAVGRLWPPGNADACTRAIVDASRDVSAAARARVREHFTRHFSWPAIGRRAIEIYAEAAARRS